MSTETIPDLPPIPPDLPGWAWEVSPAGDGRLANPAEGYATSWGPLGPAAEIGGRVAEARRLVARDAALAAEEIEARAIVVAEEPGLPQLSTTMQRHVDRALAADRKGGEALWEKACAVADARADAQRYGEWGLFLTATGLQERAAQRLVAIATRGRADGRFRDAVIGGWLSFSVAHLTAQADDALIEQLLAAPVAPSKRQAEQLLAPNNPSPGTGSLPAAPIGAAPRPHPPCARCGVPSRELAGKHCMGCYMLLEAQKWADGSEEARWRLWGAQQEAERDPDEARRTRRLAEIAGIAQGMGFATLEEAPRPTPDSAAPEKHPPDWEEARARARAIGARLWHNESDGTYTLSERAGHVPRTSSWSELKAWLADAERRAADAADPLAPIRSAIIAGPYRWDEAARHIADLRPQAEQETWLDALTLVRRADAAMRQRDPGAAWDALGSLVDDELKARLLDIYAGAARELGLDWPPPATRAARPGEDPPPALPAGWSWRERPDGSAQAWDGTLARLTACHPPARATDAAAEAWRLAGAPLAPNPAPAEAFEALAARAQATGRALAWDAPGRRFVVYEGGRGPDARYSYYPAGSETPAAGLAAWEAAAARVEHLLAQPPAARPPVSPADPTADQPRRYPAAERALAADLRAAPRRLRRLLCLAWGLAAASDEPVSEDELFDELTSALLAATDEALGWALGEDAPAAERWPHADHPALEALSAELMGAELARTPPDAGELARWQDALDAHAADVSDETYERLAHRIGELRAREAA